MALVVKKLEGETWKQAASRYAAKRGLAEEVAETFDDLVDVFGLSDENAALAACVGWGVTEFEDRL